MQHVNRIGSLPQTNYELLSNSAAWELNFLGSLMAASQSPHPALFAAPAGHPGSTSCPLKSYGFSTRFALVIADFLTQNCSKIMGLRRHYDSRFAIEAQQYTVLSSHSGGICISAGTHGGILRLLAFDL